MKTIPKTAIAAILALAAIALILVFVKASAGPAPQVDPASIPDYSKMTPEEISAAHNATPGNAPPPGADAGAAPQTGRG